ncbi:MAG TPA: hypothetical protein VHN74_20365 [Candidatus Angelobacter sp.]|nr:hypothetical protein [Candidatus Angelobacter sp.]
MVETDNAATSFGFPITVITRDYDDLCPRVLLSDYGDYGDHTRLRRSLRAISRDYGDCCNLSVPKEPHH